MIAEPHDRFIAANGLRFHAIDWGGPASAGWIVLLHGLASQAHIWDLVAPQLARRWRVIALDQRGHGLTDKPDDDYDFASVTRDLESVVEACAIDRPVLIGHSWGGNVALQYAVHHPDRVAGLVFVDGGFLEIGSRADWPTTEKLLEPPDLAGMSLIEFKSKLRAWLGPVWSEAAESILIHNFEVSPDQTIRPHMRKVNHMKVVRALWEHRPSELYTAVRCPVLMIPAIQPEPHDERALAFIAAKRQQVDLAEQGLARSRTIWLKDTLHDIPLHRPDDLAQAIEQFVGDNT